MRENHQNYGGKISSDTQLKKQAGTYIPPIPMPYSVISFYLRIREVYGYPWIVLQFIDMFTDSSNYRISQE